MAQKAKQRCARGNSFERAGENERVSERRIRLEVPRHAGDELLDVRGPSAPGGGLQKAENLPAGIVNYILSEDIDGTLKKIQSSGGAVVMPKAEIPGMGWFAVFPGPDRNYARLVRGGSATAGGPRAVPATCHEVRTEVRRQGPEARPTLPLNTAPTVSLQSGAPWTGITAPVTFRASSEQRNVTTSATS